MSRATRRLLSFGLGLVLLGCFDSETKVLGNGDETDGGAGGQGGGDPLPEGQCTVDVLGDTLEGFSPRGDRWTEEGGRLVARDIRESGEANGLLLRGLEETCSEFTAAVEFEYTPGAFPILVGRAVLGGGWYGVGYNGEFGLFEVTNGFENERREQIGRPDFVDLEPGETYRLELRVVESTVTGMLFDRAGDRPLSVVHGAGAELIGAGRIALFESNGVTTAFGPLSASPIVRAAGDAPVLESARTLDARTVVVTLSPPQPVPLTVVGAPDFVLQVNGQPRSLESVSVRPGSLSELVLTSVDPLYGEDRIELAFEGTGVQDASQRALTPFEATRVVNILHADPKAEPFVEPFDGNQLGAGWLATQPEAFSVSGGSVRVAATDPFATGAFLQRRPAERLRDAAVEGLFRFDPMPDRMGGRVEAVLALRARSAAANRLEAAVVILPQSTRLVLRHAPGGQPVELVTSSADRALEPNTPYQLRFSASGPLLWATLADAEGRPVVEAAVRTTDHLEAGPAGLTGQFDGTVRFDEFRVEPAAAPPPVVASARVRAAAPDRVELEVLAASALQVGGPEGFTVHAGELRVVTAVETTSSGLTLRLSDPPIQAGQRVTVRYDAERGRVTDSSLPVPQPLVAFDTLVARNEAPPGADLAVASARLVTPHTLDVLTTEVPPTGLTTRGDAGGAFRVTVNGRPEAIRRAYPLGGLSPNTIRLTLEGETSALDDVIVGYVAQEADGVSDLDGRPLRGFADAPVEWQVSRFTPVPPVQDGFGRADGVELGNGWTPRTAPLWGLANGRLRFTSPGVDGLDLSVVRPVAESGNRFAARVSATIGPFDPNTTRPLATLLGPSVPSTAANTPTVGLAFDFISQAPVLTDARGFQTQGPRLETDQAFGGGQQVVLELEVDGQGVRGRVRSADGASVSEVQTYLAEPAAIGSVALAGGSASGVVLFDDFEVSVLEAPPPNMLVTDALVTPDAPDAVLVRAATALGVDGRLVTDGSGRGWRVEVEGRVRSVRSVEVLGTSLRLSLEGEAIAQRERVTVSYDDREGDVHDDGLPIARPLDTFSGKPVRNGAGVGGELFVVRAEVISPDAIDLVLNPLAALPALVEAEAATSVTVTQGGAPLQIRAVVTLPGHDDRLRVALGEPVGVGQAVELVYRPAVANARVLDADGQELQPAYTLQVDNPLEADEPFDAIVETFDGIGQAPPAPWVSSPPDDFVRNAGDLVLDSEDPGVEATLLRPAQERRAHLELSGDLRFAPGPFGPYVVGFIARADGQRAYRAQVAFDGLRWALVISRTDEAGQRELTRVELPSLSLVADYALTASFHGGVVDLALRPSGADPADPTATLGRAVAVDVQPLPSGRFGLVGRVDGSARWRKLEVRPRLGFASRVVATAAEVDLAEPQVVQLVTQSNAPLLLADGRGFEVRVDDAPRALEGVSLQGRRARLEVAGAPITANARVEVTFDASAGFVYDDASVPQPLGAFSGLRARVVDGPLLTSAEQVGRNLLRLRFRVAAGATPLNVDGEGGLDVLLQDDAVGPEPVSIGVDEVWVDRTSDGDALLVATVDDLPPGATLRLGTRPRNGERVADARGIPLTDFSAPVLEDLTTLATEGDFPDAFAFGWNGPSEFAFHGDRARWLEVPGALVAIGAGRADETAEAYAPPRLAGRDRRVTVEFTLDADQQPFGRPAWPRVVVRGWNDRSWLACGVRNEPRLVPALDEGAVVGEPDPLGPALVCGRRQDGGRRVEFEACRMQFYEAEAEGGVRYDWAARALEPHRLEVVAVGRRVQARLYNLAGPEARLVAAVDVPDVGDGVDSGLPGLGVLDGGTARFGAFEVTPASPDDLEPIPFMASGECR
jgi:hypothetical protein